MPMTILRRRVVEERVKVACSNPNDIFRDAFGILKQAVRGEFMLPDKSSVQARIDRAKGLGHVWSFPATQKPWNELRAAISARLEPMEQRETKLPAERRNTHRELLRWRAALYAVNAVLSNDAELVQNEELLNSARALWSMHDKQPGRRGKRRGKMRYLQKENTRLRSELARLGKRK